MNRSLPRIWIALVVSLYFHSYAAAQSPAAPSPAAPSPAVPSTKVFLKGMVCSFCAQGLIKAFKAAEGVRTVQASLDDGSITLQFMESKTMSEQTISKIVKDSGYDVKKIELLAN